MKYYVTVGTRSVEVELEDVVARLEAIPGTPLVRLHLGDEAWTVAAERLEGEDGSGSGRWALLLEGERVEVGVTDARTRGVAQGASGAPAPTGETTVAAPMPGLVVRVLVAEGAHVRAGTGLVVLEAMKMENALRAPRTGTVRRVHVAQGQAVEKGAPLVTLEAGGSL